MFDQLPAQPVDPFSIPSGMQPAPKWANALQMIGATLQDVGNGGKTQNALFLGERQRAQQQQLEGLMRRQQLAKMLMSQSAPAPAPAPQIAPMTGHESPVDAAPTPAPGMDPLRQIALMRFVQDNDPSLMASLMPKPMTEYERANIDRARGNDAQKRADAQRTEDLAQLDQGSKEISDAMAPKDVAQLGVAAPGLSWRQRLSLGEEQQKKDYQNSPEYKAKVAGMEADAGAKARLPYEQQLILDRAKAVEDRMDQAAAVDMSDPATASNIQAIARYDVPLPTPGRANPILRRNMIAEVLKVNPDFSENYFEQSKKAFRDFGTGSQGNVARSLNVSVEHLETLRELGEALQNGDVNAINAAKQSWQEAFGTAAPTNFDTAKAIVADEVAKGVIGGQTAQQDRETLAASLRRSRSPAQIIGSIKTFQDLLGGQLRGLRGQYERTTRRKDFDDAFLSDRTRKALGAGGKPKAAADPELDGLLKQYGGR